MGGTKQLTGKYTGIAEKMLQDVVKILDTEKIPYVLEGGTLLGIVREQRLLPWDSDLDLTITRPYAEKLIAARWRFRLKGYRTKLMHYEKDTPHFKKGSIRLLVVFKTKFFFLKDYALMDLFIKDLIDDKYFWTVSQKKQILKSAARHYYENIIHYPFKGRSYSIPKDYDVYLQSRYGDWTTPKHSWDFTKDDLSIEKMNRNINL